MESSSSNPDLLALATASVQAQERLHLELKKRKVKKKDAFDHSIQALEHLQSLKAELEDRDFKLHDYSSKVTEEGLQSLRQLCLMHVPSSVTEDVRGLFQEKLQDIFEGWSREVLFAAIITCPWYWATQEERGQQAKHNSILVIYVGRDEEFFAPINRHFKEQHNVIDLGWFYAAEVFHFCNYAVKGKQRFVEALCLPQTAIIFESDQWINMKTSLTSQLLNLRGFLEQCRGQAIGGISKKSKVSGQMRLSDKATLYEMSQSFRLLHSASCVLNGEIPSMDCILEADNLSDVGKEALRKLQAAYQDETMSKLDLFDIVQRWKKEVDCKMSKAKFNKLEKVQEELGKWQADVRCCQKNENFQKLVVEDSARDCLLSLMKKIGGPVASMEPEQIVMIAQAGSYLYDLATPDSDVDYIIVYLTPTEKIISSCGIGNESYENRGPQKQFEYGAYEARLFCEMLSKGSVVILELVFSLDLEYTSSAWRELVSHKQDFVTETAIQQYLGLVKNNMKMIEGGKHQGTSRERKLFYQTFHKLDSLEYFLQGNPPPVKCSGHIKDFIMKIRQGPLEGEISREILFKLAEEKLQKLQSAFAGRACRLPEHANTKYLTDWLMRIRGWKVEPQS
ncbi:uncharacterized protein LOC106178780 isoform X2 [Lingula anatina]|uniref:Uncharacterized protein LOC106178780 isoform X2 n=1 Tax=Lingula anatina TaxID=7574 RepID=A0A1S3K4K7_LINAN|nr:uncharacterized protein LOC106178780 isoform X2 [Lingula anatina]|eukprot:XP_013417565.1 uncharacterized protein LOC106178780 isoform X2 [Lingula anatina]